MPRMLDAVQRRRDITSIAIRILSEAGLDGLTLRSIADELGGSITLVTHIYPTRRDLLLGLAETLLEEYDALLPELEAGRDRPERLRILLEWMLPRSEDGWSQERSRIVLLTDPDTGLILAAKMDLRMRTLIRDHLIGLVPADELDEHVELLRVLTNGIVLASVEHRDEWPAERQVRTLHSALRRLDLLPVVSPA
jgi:AcrR family transcriptional regulator